MDVRMGDEGCDARRPGDVGVTGAMGDGCIRGGDAVGERNATGDKAVPARRPLLCS